MLDVIWLLGVIALFILLALCVKGSMRYDHP